MSNESEGELITPVSMDVVHHTLRIGKQVTPRQSPALQACLHSFLQTSLVSII
jgi:hypothetical protein